jgi:hypothetical protein
MKISGANRVSATDLPPYDDVKPIAEALIEVVPEPIMWGTDSPHPYKSWSTPMTATSSTPSAAGSPSRPFQGAASRRNKPTAWPARLAQT